MLTIALVGERPAAASEPHLMSTAPTVTSVSPDGGPLTAGDVVIDGTGFSGATAVDFGSDEASTFGVQSSTEIVTRAPSEAAGAVDVTVTTPGDTSRTTKATWYAYIV